MIAEPPVRERRKPARGWRGWRGPTEHKPFPSLGWSWLDWTFEYLPSPADERQPLIYTPEQARRIVRWGEIDPITGDYVYLRLILEEAKGYGKSPKAASLNILELAGPVCFDGWDADGEPVGVPWGTGNRPPPWVQIAAVSEDQSENTYGALHSLLMANDGRAADALRIDAGRTRLYLRDRPGRLDPVTASAGSREGQRLTNFTADETQLWLPSNGGVKLIRTLRRNVAKMNGRSIETCNAPTLGEKSVAESSNPDKPESGVLHYNRQPTHLPDPAWSDAELRAEIANVYGDAHWINPDRLVHDVRDAANPWDDSLRYFFNVRTSHEARATDPRQWDTLARTIEVPAGTLVGAGFDGSEFHDATVIRVCTADGHSFIWRYWARPPGVMTWQVPRLEVEQAVAELFSRYTVGLMLCDPPRWWTEIAVWQERYGEDRVKVLDTYAPRQMAPAVDRWRTAIRGGTHTHDGDPFTSDQVKAARLKKVRIADVEDDRTMYLLDKDGKIGNDAAIADCLAYEAAMTMVAPPPKPKPFVVFGKPR